MNSLRNISDKSRRAEPSLVRRSIVALVVLVAVLATLYPIAFIWNESRGALPRRLSTGDSWNYKVVFPDSESYQLTVSVRGIVDLNGIEAYVILYDDAQHLSTQYLWITLDWREIRTFRPTIGNLLASSTIIYTPPVQLFQVPFHIGDKWTVNSTVHTITKVKNTTITSTELLLEERTTSSIEEISTPLRQFQTFKVTVMQNETLYETLWFNAGLGQVVYGEFYNDHEKVTQTLTSYKLNTNTTSAPAYAFLSLAEEMRLVQQYRGWETFDSYI